MAIGEPAHYPHFRCYLSLRPNGSGYAFVGQAFRCPSRMSGDPPRTFRDVQLHFDGDDLKPGDSAFVRLYPMFPESWPPVSAGDIIDLFIPPNVIGQCRVVEVVEGDK